MGGPQDKPVEPLVESLTRREREVLGLLAESLSAPEIAERLTLAVSSVKWYIQQLYGKLGVNSKQRAILRARELGLLGADRRAVGAAPQVAETEAGPPPRHNLPLQVSRFFGREAEIALLKARLAEHRLVTLAGSGGVGKTRLSLQAAEELLDDFSGGVWFAALAPLTDPALVAQTVAAAVGLRDEPGLPIIEALTQHLRPRQALLVLDNCEHLLQTCAALADSLLRGCPRLKILASSREPLGIDGEAVLAVPSLPFPTAERLPPIHELTGYPSVRLFIDRVRLVLPNYQLAPDNAAAIARICQRLDGIPLALEMAAARMSLLGADQLADRLDDAFRLLTGGSRAALPRQQTLRATLDWSYRLLDDAQRLLLQRLSVFAGGCTLEAAEAVCAGDGLEAGQAILPSEIVEVLGALVAKSMVLAEHPPGEAARYHLLETVRQYAREKLNDTGETARLHNRHLDYYLAFAEDAFPRLQAPEAPAWRPKVVAERDNLRHAMDWSFSGNPPQIDAGPRLVVAVIYAPWRWKNEELNWRLRGIDLCRRRPEISPRLHIKLLEQTSALSQSDEDALSFALQAVEIGRGLGSEGRETLMWCLFQLAGVQRSGDDRFERMNAAMTEAESILESIRPGYYAPEEELRVRGFFAQQRADFANQQGQHLEAKRYAAESIRLYEASGSGWFANMGHTQFGIACEGLGDYAEAEAHFLAAMNLVNQIPAWDSGYEMRQLARIDLRQGRLEQALQHCRASTRLAQSIPSPNIIASNVGLLAAIRAQQDQPLRAARLSGASAAMFARLKRAPWEDTTLDTLLPGWREGPQQAAIAEAFEAGQAMSTEAAVALALEDDDMGQLPDAAA